jgi:hypothetical protein
MKFNGTHMLDSKFQHIESNEKLDGCLSVRGKVESSSDVIQRLPAALIVMLQLG